MNQEFLSLMDFLFLEDFQFKVDFENPRIVFTLNQKSESYGLIKIFNNPDEKWTLSCSNPFIEENDIFKNNDNDQLMDKIIELLKK